MWKFSTNRGSAGNTIQSTPGLSLGGYLSTSVIQNSGLNNLFSSVNQDQLLLSLMDYVCIFLHNTDATTTVTNLELWFGPASFSNFSLSAANDNVGISSASSVTVQSDQVPTPFIAPRNVGFFIFPENQSEALTLPDLPPNYCVPVWFQRTMLYSGPVASENITLFLSGIVKV